MTAVQETALHYADKVYDPFSQEGPWLQRYMTEGYFGQAATLDRSEGFEQIFATTSLKRIHDLRKDYRNKIEGIGEDTWVKNLEIANLRGDWESIPKGGKEELEWTERAVALAAAGYEEHVKKLGKKDFFIRDNQLYYTVLVLLNKGAYDFGSLEKQSRAIELPTGEGKTIGFGLAAPLLSLRGEKVHVVEPNYNSALNHARQMGEFYYDFFGVNTGVLIRIPEEQRKVFHDYVDEKGQIRQVPDFAGGMRNYVYQEKGEEYVVTHPVHISTNPILRPGQLTEPMSAMLPRKKTVVERPGRHGSKQAWSSDIVFVDRERLAFDWLSDRQIGATQQSGQPDLSTRTGLIAEADETALDIARTPFVISEEARGGEAWGSIFAMLGLESHLGSGPPWKDTEKRQQAHNLTVNIWANLSEAKRAGYFKRGQGEEFDYEMSGHTLVLGDKLIDKSTNVAIQAVREQFGYEEGREEAAVDKCFDALFPSFGALDLIDSHSATTIVSDMEKRYVFSDKQNADRIKALIEKGYALPYMKDRMRQILQDDRQDKLWKAIQVFIKADSELSEETKDKALSVFSPENRGPMKEAIGWIVHNHHVVDAAVEVLFGAVPGVDYLQGQRPVLLDAYGFPLERHQMHDMAHVFLQLQNLWQKKGFVSELSLAEQPLTADLLQRALAKTAPQISISHTTDRITIPTLLQRYGTLRMSSGSVLPAASTLSDLYDAETVVVSRHIPTPENIRNPKEHSIRLRCLDGGIAQVQFFRSDHLREVELAKRATEIKNSGRVGLFIVPDLDPAQRVQQKAPWVNLVTGKEVLERESALDHAVRAGETGQTIVTTWMAHRDVDVTIPRLAKDSGGLENVVCGMLPTERALNQALQRALRGDMPGDRFLLLTPEDFEPIKNYYLFHRPEGLFQRSASKLHHDQVRRIDNLWDEAIKGEQDAMEKLLHEYILHLRRSEEDMSRQLMGTLFRDERLDQWKDVFLEGVRTSDLKEIRAGWADLLVLIDHEFLAFMADPLYSQIQLKEKKTIFQARIFQLVDKIKKERENE
ncbi:MAG: hypothetical protein WC489_05370 [Patescibacteria group bacterium]